MERYVLGNPALPYHLLQRLAVIQVGKHEPVLLEPLVTLDNLQGNIQQFNLEIHFRLVTLGQYPFLTVHFCNVIGGQFLYIHKRQGGEAGKDKQISDISQLPV